MSTNTYVALDKVTVGTATSSVTISPINSGYTDLVLVASITGFSATDELGLRVNADTGNSYSRTFLYGNGTNALSSRNTSINEIRLGSYQSGPQTIEINFMNYANTTTYKTVISKGGGVGNIVSAGSHLWQNTNAITSITIRTSAGSTISTGSTFSLYGIKAESVLSPTAKATGGTITTDQFGYVYHTFTSSGTFTPSQSLTCDAMVLAGGGGGGQMSGGGGGAGGLLGLTSQSFAATGYSVTIGGGGAGSSTTSRGSSGVDSSIAGFTSAVGGGGGGSQGGTATGATGGSGGGGSYSGAAGGLATIPQGFNGGSGSVDAGAGGGGGGAGALGINGQTGSPYASGNGGAGSSAYASWALITSTGVSGLYAGGGGGGNNSGANTPGTGGTGGGGNGRRDNLAGSAGTTNTGSGGGGGGDSTAGYSGGSGIVIIRYYGA